MPGALDDYGSSLKGLIADGAGEKAILYVYMADISSTADDDQEKQDLIDMEKDLMKKASSKLGIKDSIKNSFSNAGSSIKSSIKSNFSYGGNSSEKIGEVGGVNNHFVKFTVQYNPESISITTLKGWQEKKLKNEGGDGIDNLRGFDIKGKTRMSFDLVFDDVDNMNAFLLNDVVNMNVTNAAKKGLHALQHGKSEYSVRKRMDAIMSLLCSTDSQHVIFFWSRMCFRGIITEVRNTFTMFNPKGNPIRGTMHIEITQDSDKSEDFGYSEKYWEDAFTTCFKESHEGYAGSHSYHNQVTNNSLLNFSI